jgi:hypothetical protein
VFHDDGQQAIEDAEAVVVHDQMMAQDPDGLGRTAAHGCAERRSE